MSSPTTTGARAGRGGKTAGLTPWLLLAAVLAIVWLMRPARPGASESRFVGRPLPPLNVAGWLNTDAPPADESIRGRVVLVDFWFAQCPPCVAAMPHLAELREQFRDQGLVVLGLTPDDGDELAGTQAVIDHVEGFDWPVGYGADVPIDMIGVFEYPTLLVFDRSGRSVWAGHRVDESLEAAIVEALADVGADR